MTALIVLEKMVVLVALMLIGFGCAKAGWIDGAFSQAASRLVMNVFIVGLIVGSAAHAGAMLTYGQLALSAGVIFLVFFIGGILGWVTAKLLGLGRRDGNVVFLSVFFMNNVFIGFPLVEALFGQEAIFCAALSNIPFNLLLYSVGVARLRAGEGRGGVRLRNVVTPPMVATLAAVLIFIFRVPLPSVVSDALTTLGSATVPMSMLVIGTSLSQVPIRKALTDGRVYAACFAKLILCPILTWGLVHLLLPAELEMVKGIFILISACPSAAMITILSVRFGADDLLASKINFLSTLLCALTLPVMTYFLL